MKALGCQLAFSLSALACSAGAYSAPVKYEVCDYHSGRLLCRDFDPVLDGRRADFLLAKRELPPTPMPEMERPKSQGEASDSPPSESPAPVQSAPVPTPVAAPVAPVVKPSSVPSVGDPKGMAPYIPVTKR